MNLSVGIDTILQTTERPLIWLKNSDSKGSSVGYYWRRRSNCPKPYYNIWIMLILIDCLLCWCKRWSCSRFSTRVQGWMERMGYRRILLYKVNPWTCKIEMVDYATKRPDGHLAENWGKRYLPFSSTQEQIPANLQLYFVWWTCPMLIDSVTLLSS